MNLAREEPVKLFDEYGFEYKLDSPTPGIHFSDGSFKRFDELPLPSEYLGDLEWMAEYERQLLASLEEEA